MELHVPVASPYTVHRDPPAYRRRESIANHFVVISVESNEIKGLEKRNRLQLNIVSVLVSLP